MALLNEDFGGQVVGRPAERKRLLALLEHFSQTEVSQANIAIAVHEDILWLQISVDNVLVVQVSERNRDLNGVELSSILVEPLRLPQMHEQFATADELHDEKDLLFSHEDEGHADEEGVIGFKQDVLLQLC